MENRQRQQRQWSSSWCSCLLSPIFSFLQKFRNPYDQTPIPPLDIDASQSPNPTAPLPSADPSSSSAANSLPLPISKFEVFLSFRGPDTRRGFTDFLYTFLIDARIRTYRDDEEIRKGEEIGPELLAAISDSKIAIPIFSGDYAGSKWCLHEIAKIVECKNSTGQKILPVFYHVEPSDARHQTGCYADAFRCHEKHFDANTVQKWREALSEVGALKGWMVKQNSKWYLHGLSTTAHVDRHEGSIVKEVALAVLSDLRGDYMLQTDELVGIENKVEEVMKLLKCGHEDVKIVGIHGMGGIGKTTIATVIYNQLSADFEHRCFLADIRELLEQHDGQIMLQDKLISGILKEKASTISNLSEGINVIKNRVCKEKVLLVLDDVDSKFRFDKILGKREWFSIGSKIIITTRDKKVLNALKVDGMYEPEELEPHYSLQLFCKHAFGEDTPPQYFVKLSEEIVSTAAGLPLALKVIGSLLFGEEIPIWEETLKQLREIPPDEVQEKLKVSFYALTYEQKQIFLDVACLFIGVDKDIASYMWDDCSFYPTIGINVLILRSLVKIGDHNEFKMHDQLRDMGRAIVREENVEDPHERSRLWSHKDAWNTLRGCKGTEKVKALCVDLNLEPESERCLTNLEFSKLSNLRYLQINCADVTGHFDNNPFLRLRWLEWRNCPASSSPTNLQLINLVILDLSRSEVTNDWEGWNEIKMAKKLQVLDLSFCGSLITTPDLSAFQNHERLNLEGCRNLIDINPSFRNLKNLRMLQISGSQIKKLPSDIEGLEKLQDLDASWCDSLEGDVPTNIVRLTSLKSLILQSTVISGLPDGLCRLSCLQTLDLEGTEVHWLPELPSSLCKLIVPCNFPNLQNLVHLQELRFFDCNEHVDVPKDIWKLSKLEILSFHLTNIRILPAEIGKLSLLKELAIISCNNFQTLLGLPSGLDKLYVQQRGNPEPGIERLPSLLHLKNLTGLRLRLPKVTKINGLGGLRCLVELIITGCKNVATLDGLDNLQSLRILFMDECDSLERLPDLSKLRKLKWLDSSMCGNLIEIQGVGSMESLEKLNIEDCVALEILPDLSGLEMLKQLNLSNCQSLQQIEGLPALKSLVHLDVSDCQSLVNMPDLSQLEMLERLILNDSQKLREIEALGAMKSLEVLNVSGCIKLEALPDVSNLKNLQELLMNECIKLTKVPGLEELTSLKLLEMNGYREFENLPGLSRLKSLEKNCSSSCKRVAEIKGLEELSSLALLDISGCMLIKNLPEMPNTEIIR